MLLRCQGDSIVSRPSTQGICLLDTRIVINAGLLLSGRMRVCKICVCAYVLVASMNSCRSPAEASKSSARPRSGSSILLLTYSVHHPFPACRLPSAFLSETPAVQTAQLRRGGADSVQWLTASNCWCFSPQPTAQKSVSQHSYFMVGFVGLILTLLFLSVIIFT